MSNATYKFLNTLSQVFIENRLDTFTEHCAYPLPIYANDELQVFGAPCTLKEVLTIYRDAAIRTGIVRIVPRVLAEGLPVNGYSNVWVEWDHCDAEGKCVRTSQVHYVFYRADGTLFPKIEMLEYTDLAFPEVCDIFTVAKIA